MKSVICTRKIFRSGKDELNRKKYARLGNEIIYSKKMIVLIKIALQKYTKIRKTKKTEKSQLTFPQIQLKIVWDSSKLYTQMKNTFKWKHQNLTTSNENQIFKQKTYIYKLYTANDRNYSWPLILTSTIYLFIYLSVSTQSTHKIQGEVQAQIEIWVNFLKVIVLFHKISVVIFEFSSW